MSAIPRPQVPDQMGSTEAMVLVMRGVDDGDPLDKWLLTAVADCGTLDPATLARYTLITEADVATRLLRLQFETPWIERLAGRWQR